MGAKDQALHWEWGVSPSDHAQPGEGRGQRQVRMAPFSMASFFIQHFLGCCKFLPIGWRSANIGFYSSCWFLSFSGEEWEHVVANSTLFLMPLIECSLFIRRFPVLPGAGGD